MRMKSSEFVAAVPRKREREVAGLRRGNVAIAIGKRSARAVVHLARVGEPRLDHLRLHVQDAEIESIPIRPVRHPVGVSRISQN